MNYIPSFCKSLLTIGFNVFHLSPSRFRPPVLRTKDRVSNIVGPGIVLCLKCQFSYWLLSNCFPWVLTTTVWGRIVHRTSQLSYLTNHFGPFSISMSTSTSSCGLFFRHRKSPPYVSDGWVSDIPSHGLVICCVEERGPILPPNSTSSL